MAKDKKHGHDKRDRRDRARLPKRIAGVKVPKSLRKGGAVRAIAGSPLMRDIVAAALTSAAAAISSRKDDYGHKGSSAKADATGGAILAAFATAAGDVVRQLRAARRSETKPEREDREAPPAAAAPRAEPGLTH